MTLKTRKPTGAVPWPLVLVEGGEKSGKTFTATLLAKSPKVGQMYWIDLGEASADEYGAIPGVAYEIVEHNGTFGSIYQAVTDVRAEAQKAADAKAKPVVLLLDGMNAEWGLLKGWANDRARSTDWNQKKLARNPDAEIDVSQNFWNDANARHQKLMTQLMTFPGIVVMTCRGKEVVAVDENGRPIEKKKDYRVEGQKGLGYDATCWIRLYRDKPGIIVGARSVHAGIRPGKDEPKRLDPDWSLEWVIFDWLKCDPATARVRDYIELVPDLTPEKIRDEALDPKTPFARIKELYAYTNAQFPGVVMMNGTGDEETLLRILKTAGDERQGTPAPQRDDGPVEAAHAPRDVSEPEVADEARMIRAAQAPDGEAKVSWLDGALGSAPKLASLEACTVMWRKSAEKVHASELGKADAERLQAILRKRMEELKAAPPAAAALDPDDPWLSAIEGIASAADGEALLEDVADQRGRGEIEPERAALIERAIEDAIAARFPDAGKEAEAA